MLPTFLILGAQRSGTTSLFEYLMEHPQFAPPIRKELHFFDRATQSLAQYRASFPYRRPGRRTGEASPSYLYHPLVPGRVRDVLPDVRLIALLRDPVERAYSQYHHERALGNEPLSFADAVVQEPGRLAADRRYKSFAFIHHSYLTRGEYGRQLERWLAHFPRERILVLLSQDLFEAPVETLRAVQDWLGVAPHTAGKLIPHNARDYDALDPGLRRELRPYFAEDAARLHDLLGVRVPWGD